MWEGKNLSLTKSTNSWLFVYKLVRLQSGCRFESRCSRVKFSINYHIFYFRNCILSQYIKEYIQNRVAYLLSPYVVYCKECFPFSLVEVAREIKKKFLVFLDLRLLHENR